ncbi:MAG TPA: hypothetical protein VF796_20045, partial [Humisphaera sp.]
VRMPPPPPGMKPPGPPQMMGAPGQPPAPGQPGQPAPAQPPEGEAPLGTPGGFLDQPWVQNVLPFITSVAAHAGLALLAIVLTMVAKQAAKYQEDKPQAEEQVIVPVGAMAENLPAGAIPNPGLNDKPNQEARQDQFDVPATGFASKPGPTVDMRAAGGGDGGDASGDSVIGAGPGGGSGRGSGKGVGNSFGSGDGDGSGPLAPFGAPGGGAPGPKGPVFGHGGNARKIVFICDATGTMINKMSVLRRELKAAVKDLRNGVQSYKIVWYTDNGKVLTEKGPGKEGLIVCSVNNKDATFTWLDDITPAGTTDPIPAIQAAFALKPDLIYFLSDGEFNNLRSYKEVLDEVVKGSQSSKGTKVNTILFDTIDPDAQKVMEDMSKQTNGRFRAVKVSDLEGG